MTMKRKIPTQTVMEEVKCFVGSGKNVMLPVAGNSMRPFIIGDRDSAELHPITSPLKRGDAVLAWADGNHYVLHRIVAVDGDRLTLEGDGNVGLKEYCHSSDVIAKAIYAYNGSNGRKTKLTGRWAMTKWWLWRGVKLLKKAKYYATKKRF